MKIVLKFSTRRPATSPYSRATFVKYSSGLLFSGPSDHRLSPSEGPAGNFLRTEGNIQQLYDGVRMGSTRRKNGALRAPRNGECGVENRRCVYQPSPSKTPRPSI